MKRMLYADLVEATRETFIKLLAKRAGGKFNVRVSCDGGNTASVARDNFTIELHLPSIEPAAIVTPDDAMRILALCVHETLHILHTDMAGGHMAQARQRSNILGDILNAIEDVRIERKEIETGPFEGTKGLLSDLMERHFLASLDADGGWCKPVNQHVAWAIAVIGRSDTGHYGPLLGTAKTPGAIAEYVRIALDGLPACQSTDDAYRLACKVFDAMAQDEKNESQKGQGEGQKGQGEGQTGKGQGEGQTGKGQDTASQDDGKEDNGKPQRGALQANKAPPAGKTLTAGIGQHLEKMARQNITKQGQVKATTGANMAAMPRSKFRKRKTSNDVRVGTAAARLAQVPSQAAIRDKMRRVLRALERVATSRFQDKGRLDRKAAGRIAAGRRDVFQIRSVTPGVDTAVTLLLDQSGSMSGDGIKAAQTLALVLGDAIEKAGGTVLIAGFADPERYHANAVDVSSPIDVWKERRQRVAQVADVLASLDCPWGTWLSPALSACADEILAQRAARRILMVLTDGECAFGASGVRAASDLCEARGVEVIGIGCQHVLDPDGFRKRVNVMDLSTLSTVAMKSLVAVLEGRKVAD